MYGKLYAMKRTLSLAALLVFSILPLQMNSTAYAAPTNPTKTIEKVGYDISYPQCKSKIPTTYYFAIIGVNGGNAASINPCLAKQLQWAKDAKGGTAQAEVQLYVNTANPGEYIGDIKTWPKNNYDLKGRDVIIGDMNPYGSCDGTNSKACGWLYGWNRAIDTAENMFAPAAITAGLSKNVSDYTWWLDVETMNTWQLGSADKEAKNVASLEGMYDYYKSHGGRVGLYSTAVQWDQITGSTTNDKFKGLPNWRPSGTSLQIAINNCKVDPLTEGGYISLTQYIVQNLDRNHTCI